jgi:hypothetical protein
VCPVRQGLAGAFKTAATADEAVREALNLPCNGFCVASGVRGQGRDGCVLFYRSRTNLSQLEIDRFRITFPEDHSRAASFGSQCFSQSFRLSPRTSSIPAGPIFRNGPPVFELRDGHGVELYYIPTLCQFDVIEMAMFVDGVEDGGFGAVSLSIRRDPGPYW